jgi:uncharacterized protein Yka (UPF0111/DUF47 family)
MRLTLLGSEFRFFELFTAQSNHLVAATGLLKEAIFGFPRIREYGAKIHEIGVIAEDVSRDIIRELSMTSMRPTDREDVHDLNRAFTLSFTSLSGIVSRLGLYGLREIAPSIREMTENLVEMSDHVPKILEIVNRGQRIGDLSASIAEVRQEFDRFLLVGLGELYESEPSTAADVMEIVKWSQMYDRFEETMNAIHHITTILESIVMKGV